MNELYSQSFDLDHRWNGFTFIRFQGFFKYLFIFCLILNNQILIADSIENRYVPPLDIPLSISGNFGDIRSGTFHFGVDFRTNEKTGFPVYAIANGYVSRIKIEPGGYGRAIYINHPNGTTSVYGHLKALKNEFAEFIKNEQYKRESFFIDYYFEPDQFPIKQCEIIGFSGNAGLSSGPHLHFEIRDSRTQNPLNPIVEELPIIDTFKPVIKSLWVYSNTGYGSEKKNKSKNYQIVGSNGDYKIKNNNIIELPEYAGLGIETFDEITDPSKKLSFFSSQMFLDSVLWFEMSFDQMSFDQVNYVNSCIDYEQKNAENINIYKHFLLPNQEMLAYKKNINRGWLNFSDSSIHAITFVVTDEYGNVSNLHVLARKSLNQTKWLKEESSHAKYFLNYAQKNQIDYQEFSFVFPENSLYEDLCITTQVINTQNFSFFHVVNIGNSNLIVKKPFSININVKSIPETLRKKLVVVSVDTEGKVSSIGGTLEGEILTASSKSFGSFSVLPDTVKPNISPVNISKLKNMTDENEIRIKISDSLSGIAEYRGTIDKKWVLFEFDSKSNLLTYTFDTKRLIQNNSIHQLILTLVDKKGNKNVYSTRFIK